MGRGAVTSPAVLALLSNVDPGAGAPFRVPAKGGTPPTSDPNATRLQKLFAPNLLQPAIPIFDKTKYGYFQVLTFALLVAGVDQLALNRPSQLRVSLMILNSVASAGVINIGFDVPALGGSSSMTLPAGGIVLFDEFVPQNDIHISCNLATSFVAITYCDAPFP